MNLHPYDNVERRYRHTDGTRGEGRDVVAQVLGLPKPPAGELLFDLSFFSGRIGVLDRLAIAFPADPLLWSTKKGCPSATPRSDSSIVNAASFKLSVCLTYTLSRLSSARRSRTRVR